MNQHSRTLASRLLAPLWLGGAILVLAGCGGSGTGTVKGQVSFGGKPLPGGRITFTLVKGKGNPGSSVIDANGNYSLKAPSGEVIITVDNRELKQAPSLPIGMGGDPSGAGKTKGGRGGPKGEGAPMGSMQEKMKSMGAPTVTAAKQIEGKYIEIPAKYHTSETSDLRFTVKSGEQTHNVELK
jgi:hypothetical protein